MTSSDSSDTRAVSATREETRWSFARRAVAAGYYLRDKYAEAPGYEVASAELDALAQHVAGPAIVDLATAAPALALSGGPEHVDTDEDRYYRPIFDGLCGEGYWDACRPIREQNRARSFPERPDATLARGSSCSESSSVSSSGTSSPASSSGTVDASSSSGAVPSDEMTAEHMAEAGICPECHSAECEHVWASGYPASAIEKIGVSEGDSKPADDREDWMRFGVPFNRERVAELEAEFFDECARVSQLLVDFDGETPHASISAHVAAILAELQQLRATSSRGASPLAEAVALLNARAETKRNEGNEFAANECENCAFAIQRLGAA